MHRNQSVNLHNFAMIPRVDIPRSSFRMQKALKMTFDAGLLVPFFCEEVLPGDTFNVRVSMFCRMSTPLLPFMDNVHLESFFFHVPNRLVWTNWQKFMGEQDNPADSTSFSIPQLVSPVAGYVVNSLGDMFGLPTVGQVTAGLTFTHSALPFRCYNLIWNQWFRDENLQNSVAQTFGDGPDAQASYTLLRRGKRPDYFTTCLPWAQKGGVAVTLPLGTSAPVKGIGVGHAGASLPAAGYQGRESAYPAVTGTLRTPAWVWDAGDWGAAASMWMEASTSSSGSAYPMIWADLSSATAATVNQLRQSIAIQHSLERDARGGTRYIEIIRQRFGVISPDARLQRSEYLGGGRTAIAVNEVAQTAQTGLTGGSTPLGSLAGVSRTVATGHGFTQSFTEHGHVIGLLSVNADLTYQQGMRRFWSRLTRYDFYDPVFANLGEQSVLNKEIYLKGDANDNLVFGYQARWDEYRYNPSQIMGLFRSTSAGTIDQWHLSQNFGALPLLNASFIEDKSDDQISRALAVGAAADGKQFLLDAFFDIKAARPLPMYSVPGLAHL